MSAVEDIALEEGLAQKPMSLALLRRLLAWAKPYRPYLFLNLAATTLAVGSQLAGPKLIQKGIDNYLTHITSSSDAAFGIFVISALYLGNLLLGWGVSVAQVRSAVYVGQGMMNDLRLAVFEHIQRLSLSYFDKTHQGRIISRADTFTELIPRMTFPKRMCSLL